MNSSLLRTLHITGLSFVAASLAIAADPADTTKAPADGAAPKVQVTRPVELIDINTADAATLQRLPGITEEIAAAIIKARPFKNEDDLAKVEGVGEARASILKSQIMASNADDTSSKTDEPQLTPTGRDNPDDQKKPATDAADKDKTSTDKPSTDATATPSADKSSAGEAHKSATDANATDKNVPERK
jgi:hypothetical protein